MIRAVWPRRFPWSITAVAAALVLFGWAGMARYEELTEANTHFLRQQIVWSIVAAAALLAVALPNYRIFCHWTYPIYAASLVSLSAVYLFSPVNGAHRWLRLGPITVQPSEFAKIALVLAAARYLMYGEGHRRLRGLAIPLGLALGPVLLVLREPDLGTAALFLPVMLIMLFAAGARRGDLVKLLLAGVLVLPLVWTQMNSDQRSRVRAFFAQPTATQRPRDESFQLHQAKRMMALGGGWGSVVLGRTVDDPAVYQLPEARSDFIFCVLGERFGLPGLALVLGLYGVLAWRGLAIATATREPFGRLVAVGIVAVFAFEVLVNTAVTVGLVPVTGISLPLVSYGGSGLVAHAIGLGLLCNVGLRPGYEVSAEPFRWRV